MFNESWLEADLYWFQGAAPSTKAAEFFDRLNPLWAREKHARKGLLLCVGLLLDSALCYNGDLDSYICCCNGPKYEAWTYRRLRELVSAIHAEADKRGLSDFHVGIQYWGKKEFRVADPLNHNRGRTGRDEDVYTYSVEGKWFTDHPEVYDARFPHPTMYYGAKVSVPEDEAISPGADQTFAAYFARKLAAMAKDTGLTAVIFRDHVLHFGGRYANADKDLYLDPTLCDLWNDGLVEMITTLKGNYPDLITIGYSGYYSGMEIRRSKGFDLERLAKTGCLDLWVTQTWCSAFEDFWRADTLGYTPALMNILDDMVMLADTPTEHLFLIEGIDAWEPFESILDFPDKIEWLAWAFSHACVKMPGGKFKRSCGLYAAWMNQGSKLIPARSVERMRMLVERASSDMRRDPIPGGPCVIYDRESMEYSLRRPAKYCKGEAFDNWVPMLTKYGVPTMSATRSEWLEDVDADAWIYPMPVCTNEATARLLAERSRAGAPVLFMGQANLYSPAIRDVFSVSVRDEGVPEDLPTAAVVPDDALAKEIGTRALVVNQKVRTLEASPAWVTRIEALGGPVFARHRELPVWIWETPEWGTDHTNLTVVSIPSLQLVWAVARDFASAGWGGEAISWRESRTEFTGDFLFWRYPEGTKAILLGNLENGIMGDSKFPLHGSVTVSGNPEILRIIGPGRSSVTGNRLDMMTSGHGFSVTEFRM